jgi:hypothetical protein
VVTKLGLVGVLQGLPQVPPFRRLDAEAVDALLAMKRASDRARDRDDLEALEVANASKDEPDDLLAERARPLTGR